MAGFVGISGIRELEAGLEALGRDAARLLPSLVARKLASLAVQAWRRPELRPAPWPPLAASTLARAGAASDKASKARDRAAKYRSDAYGHDFAAGHLEGRARKSALRKAETARKKAREWRGKAKDAKAAGAAGKTMLYDTGNMWHSIHADGASVRVPAKAGKKGKEYPYPSSTSTAPPPSPPAPSSPWRTTAASRPPPRRRSAPASRPSSPP